MTLLGKNIEIRGVSQKGYNRIRYHGSVWSVLAETDHILFSPSEAGPWIFITPKGCDGLHREARWIKCNNDSDFELVID